MDCISINNVNYFNLLWQSNISNYEINSLNRKETGSEPKNTAARPPPYLIFYDLNTAQLAQKYHEYSVEKKWNLQLVESYIKTPGLASYNKKMRMKSSKTRTTEILATTKSFDELFYICQFKRSDSSTAQPPNRLEHSIIDTRYAEKFKETVKYSNDKRMFMPLRISPIVVNVNTVTNKHFYYTSLYKPISNYKPVDSQDYNERVSDLTSTSLFYICKNLSDLELLDLYEKYSKNAWKLVDLKAYKDEKCLTKFSTVWSSLSEFYEGTSKLFIGLNKNEALDQITEMNAKGMQPKLLTSYCYSSKFGEHLYALFFCQF